MQQAVQDHQQKMQFEQQRDALRLQQQMMKSQNKPIA
jgi:hypothetical protein